MLQLKLAQRGDIYCTETDNKLKLSLKVAPSALVVLQLEERSTPYFSVTTTYFRTGPMDGKLMGRYGGVRR
ncbi:hypothetical protein BH09PSE6_BH09PSE6_07280 [soil metagenome]